MNTIKNRIKKLNIILEKNYAAEKGYLEASKEISEKSLERFFLDQSKQRNTFSENLKKEIRSFGEEPVETTDFSSDLHRNWMKIREFLSLNDDEAVLKEVIRGEENAIESYNEYLGSDNQALEINNMIQEQRSYIIEALEKLRSFELIEA